MPQPSRLEVTSATVFFSSKCLVTSALELFSLAKCHVTSATVFLLLQNVMWTNLQMGNSLAKERMLEKAEQVLGRGFLLTWSIKLTNQKDRLEKMNTKQRPGTPLVRYLALQMLLISTQRGTLACSTRCSTGSLTSWGRGLVERLTLITGSRSQRFWQG